MIRAPLGNGEAVAIRFQRLRKIALRDQNVADPIIGHRQIALPVRIARVCLRQTLGSGELSEHLSLNLEKS